MYMQYRRSRKLPCCFRARNGEGLAEERKMFGVETLKEKELLGSYL
jgi:hypothetical protein